LAENGPKYGVSTRRTSEIEEGAEERRRAVRVEPGPLRVRLSGKWDGILVDISEVGALVQLPVPQTIHTPITLDVEWEHATLQLSGRVVRSSPPPGEAQRTATGLTDYYVAVEFAPLPEHSGAALKRLLDQQ
jgi:PilZ domain